jgi:nicotinamide-nucleotide amidase
MEMLGVQEATLARFGAVSEETARQMVHGALFRSKASIAVAVTGIAGPGGGSAEKPVGLVHLAAKSRSGDLIHSRMLYGDIGRAQVRLATVRTALQMLRELAQL